MTKDNIRLLSIILSLIYSVSRGSNFTPEDWNFSLVLSFHKKYLKNDEIKLLRAAKKTLDELIEKEVLGREENNKSLDEMAEEAIIEVIKDSSRWGRSE